MEKIRNISFILLFVFTIIQSGSLFCQEAIDVDNDTVMQNLLNKASNIIKSDSLFDSAYYWRSLIYFEIKNDQEALTDITKAIELNRENKNYYFFKGDIESNLGNYYEATNSYNKVIEIDSLYFDAYIELIYCFVQLKEYKNALKILEAGLTSRLYKTSNGYKGDFGIYPLLPVVFDIYQTAYLADTNDYNAIFGLGYISFAVEDLDVTKYYIEKYIYKVPIEKKEPEADLMLGTCYFIEGDSALAKKYFIDAYMNNVQIPDTIEYFIGVEK